MLRPGRTNPPGDPAPTVARVTGLLLYPVKSLRGFRVDRAMVDDLGLVGDRRFLVVDAVGRFLTQRTHPRMALIDTALGASTLTLSLAGWPPIVVSRLPDPSAPRRQVSIWRSEGLVAEDCGDAAAQWLTDVLAVPCRLVRAGPDFHRPVTKAAARQGDRVSFADAAPFLLISEGSLSDLNDRLRTRDHPPLAMDRFRPNIVIGGCPAFAEDAWPRLRIGGITFRSAGPSIRCVITTIDRETASRGVEPLRTLATYRRDPSEPTHVHFGQNLIHETTTGALEVGDLVHPETSQAQTPGLVTGNLFAGQPGNLMSGMSTGFPGVGKTAP